MRRVLLVGDYPPPWGGLSTQMAALRGHLLALGDEAVVLDIGSRRWEPRSGCLPARGPLDFARTMAAYARRGYTVHLHTNGHNTKSWLAAAVSAATGLRAGRRTVVSLGSGHMPAFLRNGSRALRALARATFRGAGACIVRNVPARDAVVALGAPPAKVRIIPGFYGVTAREIGPLPFAAARFRRGHRPLIGVMASTGPEYGVTLLIDAAARLRKQYPELGLALLGPECPPEGLPVWALPLGELDRSALLAVMRSLDVFVRPTYFDGDASSVREALAIGVRAVASDAAFRPPAVRTFPAGDADALAAAIDAALQEPPTRVLTTALPMLLDLYDALPLGHARDTPPAAGEQAPSAQPASSGARVA